MENLKKTPLHDLHIELGAKMVPFAGWDMPVQYKGLVSEHEAVRNRAGLFDVSHMGEIEVDGPQATAFVNYLVVGDVNSLPIGKVLYSLMCYENGGVVDDLLVYRKAESSYLLVINAGNIEKDDAWVREKAKEFDVYARNCSDDFAQVAIQGPLAQAILQKKTELDLDTIGFFEFVSDVEIAGVSALVSRTGYTGEDGFEIYTAPGDAPAIWKHLLEAGESQGLECAGLGARDTLRFEATLPLYGHEIKADITPLEAGLGYFVDLEGAEFIGKAALEKQKREGLELKLIGFEMIDKGIPREGYSVIRSGDVIGTVTTGYKAPTVGKRIGLAHVDIEYTKLGMEFEIEIRGKRRKAQVISKRFYTKKYKK